MAEVDLMIQRDVQDDDSIHVKGLGIDVRRKGIFSRRRLLHLVGTVQSDREKDKIASIAQHHAGDAYEILNDITVGTRETTGA